MAEHDPQLVQAITEAVIAALRQQQGGGSAPDPQGDRADIKPPVGVCTGDYSKFTDRPDLVAASAPGSQAPAPGSQSPAPGNNAATSEPASTTPSAPRSRPLTGIITARQLQEAIAATPEGVALLATDARLTPLAADFVREHPAKVRRADPAKSGAGPAADGTRASGGSTSGAGGAWLWWAAGHCPAVVATTNELGGRVAASAAPRSDAGLVDVIKDIAVGVHGKTLTGGLLFVRNAARAMVLANRCPHLRAVLGTCPEAVEQGIAQVGANVLVVEFPHVSGERIAAMTRRIVDTTPRLPAYDERVLAEMHRHG